MALLKWDKPYQACFQSNKPLPPPIFLISFLLLDQTGNVAIVIWQSGSDNRKSLFQELVAEFKIKLE
ncbi:hypothetical protein BST97_04865 [Nonlabens spongiae]|uniref:Uncharacterized protein n=1 Tax=Nonlabens spongiae TaxID=331648 RepID=A0A1W6MIP7_9FLAO|nr:hypothetical protein BST97_04865 [Nonlabens spongiae]